MAMGRQLHSAREQYEPVDHQLHLARLLAHTAPGRDLQAQPRSTLYRQGARRRFSRKLSFES